MPSQESNPLWREQQEREKAQREEQRRLLKRQRKEAKRAKKALKKKKAKTEKKRRRRSSSSSASSSSRSPPRGRDNRKRSRSPKASSYGEAGKAEEERRHRRRGGEAVAAESWPASHRDVRVKQEEVRVKQEDQSGDFRSQSQASAAPRSRGVCGPFYPQHANANATPSAFPVRADLLPPEAIRVKAEVLQKEREAAAEAKLASLTADTQTAKGEAAPGAQGADDVEAKLLAMQEEGLR